jgi:tungstate transport system ATP-binding protein
VSLKLQLNNVSKRYGNTKAIDSISFDAEGNNIIALLGVNGSGKTTLLRTMAGLERADEGSLSINNEELGLPELRKIATLVFQRTVMFSRSVYDNLAFGLRIRGLEKEKIAGEVSKALEAVGLRDFDRRKAKKTSGGEQQRIALARAFLLNPKILLLDEPTANLDVSSAKIVEEVIKNRRTKDCVIILATHNLHQAKRLADEIFHIHEGRILERATTVEFFTNPRNENTKRFINGELQF